jgi:Calcineurin-like phosphoesterase
MNKISTTNAGTSISDLFMSPPPIDNRSNNGKNDASSIGSSGKTSKGLGVSSTKDANGRKTEDRRQKLAPVSSLLPPPMKGSGGRQSRSGGMTNTDDNLQLSSWDDLMAPEKKNTGQTTAASPSSNESNGGDSSPPKNTGDLAPPSTTGTLPSIADLFPPSDLTTPGLVEGQDKRRKPSVPPSSVFDVTGLSSSSNVIKPPPSTLDGALPVGDLFFRSERAAAASDDKNTNNDNRKSGNDDGSDEKGIDGERDDEELPFSAEQSDQLMTFHNRMEVRGKDRSRSKGRALSTDDKYSSGNNSTAPTLSGSRRSSRKVSTMSSSSSKPRRRAVRRGLEMLVDGVPISADPPQRALELYYRYNRTADWSSVITTNSRDFGPIKHYPSVNLLTKEEQGLFCEYFVDSTLKWNVCPKDLRSIARGFSSKMDRSTRGRRGMGGSSKLGSPSRFDPQKDVLTEMLRLKNEAFDLDGVDDSAGRRGGMGFGKAKKETSAGGHFLTPQELAAGLGIEMTQSMERILSRVLSAKDEQTLKAALADLMAKDVSFSPPMDFSDDGDTIVDVRPTAAQEDFVHFEFSFSIDISKKDLESCDIADQKPIFERVLGKGLKSATDYTNFDLIFNDLRLSDSGDGTTLVFADFDVFIRDSDAMSTAFNRKKLEQIGSSLSRALDDGKAQIALAAAAREETDWPEELRIRLAEEFLLDEVDDDDDEEDDDDDDYEEMPNTGTVVGSEQLVLESSASIATIETDEEAVMSLVNHLNNEDAGIDEGAPSNVAGHGSDIFLGGGNDGVFPNYDAENAANSPYAGKLGLRLVDAVVERAKQRHPRVIAIGDVHGCIDELQELLRECDYRPGDLVVFLGDLVSKGPDSLSVVQLAREIGAIGVRGNHDYEVIRWAQAIKSGIDPPQARSEHYRIATKLGKADLKWMYSLPWYIHSHDLEALFVHAGFVSGIRLAKQNPRLMMNMRSILPDGTVTSKFFNNWPWARLWDGPQTVLFGHDADRGLQQYENAIGLDTGCCYGGRLSACILPEKRLVSVPAKREYFQYRRKHYD